MEMNMKKLLVAAALLISMSGVANAAYTYTAPSELQSLDHTYFYTWGINLLDQGVNINNVSITSATIKFENIYNWNTAPYALWVDLLGTAYKPTVGGVTHGTDNDEDGNSGGYTDAFSGKGVNLIKYTTGIPGDPQNGTTPPKATLTYVFTDLAALNANARAATTGIIGLGFDPDCHFYDTNVTFSITTGPRTDAVPEPATMLLFGTGLAGLAGVRMRRKKN
jgi:hypothetical protein